MAPAGGVVLVALLDGQEEAVAQEGLLGVHGQTRQVGGGDGLTVAGPGDGLTHGLVRQGAGGGVEHDVTPLQAGVLADLGVVTATGLLVDVGGEDVVQDVDLLVGEGLSHGRVVQDVQGDGLELGGGTPPLVVALQGDDLLGLVVALDLEGAREVVVVELGGAGHRLVEGLGIGHELPGGDAGQGIGPVGVDRVEGDLGGLLVHDLDLLDLVESLDGGPGVAGVLDVVEEHLDVLGVPLASVAPGGLLVDGHGDHSLAADLRGLELGEEVGVRRRLAVRGPVDDEGGDELHDQPHVDDVAVHGHGVPVRRRRADAEAQRAPVLELVGGGGGHAGGGARGAGAVLGAGRQGGQDGRGGRRGEEHATVELHGNLRSLRAPSSAHGGGQDRWAGSVDWIGGQCDGRTRGEGPQKTAVRSG